MTLAKAALIGYILVGVYCAVLVIVVLWTYKTDWCNELLSGICNVL